MVNDWILLNDEAGDRQEEDEGARNDDEGRVDEQDEDEEGDEVVTDDTQERL
jgi:hypothetical protein